MNSTVQRLNRKLNLIKLVSSNPNITFESLAKYSGYSDKEALKKELGQLFMVAAFSNKDEAHKHSIATLIQREHIGGLCFFQGTPYKQAVLTNYYQSISKVPLFISIDAEWGLAMRLDTNSGEHVAMQSPLHF